MLLTVSSYFKFPDYGVQDYVVLSRGTAFLVKTPGASQNRPIYGISSAHITHPFNFPQLYKDPSQQWIFALDESNIRVQLEYRDNNTGRILHSVHLDKPFHLHSTLDLVCFPLSLDDFTRKGLPYNASILELTDNNNNNNDSQHNQIGKLFGYQLVDEKADIMRPLETEYQLNVVESNRHFVSTVNPSPMGVCGGPAINSNNEVVGMIEGLVKLDPRVLSPGTSTVNEATREYYNRINLNSVYIPSKILKTFINTIDIQQVYDTL
ncbi:hypothetical protein SAMD00019534_048780 [Acytostelium subglobosum LB1]|uniref:hypothetical protein n=1 Tax=Acytostelium subglobosum LB1 TaxID=1410327 RepID=UPI0006448C4E|nr:hypothetical protein SAMD00019534_048780 [Acytostelium subglobosum LB1]GAM21703.1 hypothetical protein SAMD00019534_048780 [Acytostelium subglobosum LB1]|eukprot:XP_012755822.1 hypothetical protein SAMD00019534_048780 [Acytostelium subglobosum LB1]